MSLAEDQQHQHSQPNGRTRKDTRATQACDECHRRKLRCDEGRPCSSCELDAMSCQYSTKAEKEWERCRAEREWKGLFSRVESQLQQLADLGTNAFQFEKRLLRIEENTQNNTQSDYDGPASSEAGRDVSTDYKAASRSPGPDLGDHRTGPHKLFLLWPTVRNLLTEADVEHDESYVMAAEDQGETHGYSGLGAIDFVDLHAATVNTLYDSYMQNIHIMHPFLNARHLRRQFNAFIEQYSGGYAGARSPRDLTTERSPTNAIVYLVLALGKICVHHGPLPALIPSNQGPQNLEVVPGFAYYSRAVTILGDQADGSDLVHAQMFLLAGLYKGQLARVKESMSWFAMAGRATIILLDRYKLYNYNYWGACDRSQYIRSQAQIKDMRQSLIVLASWTCLQLESDILAELRLPASGIQAFEHLLLMPQKFDEDGSHLDVESDGRLEDDSTTLIYYSAQLFLRRRLNQVHREIYGKASLNQPLSKVQDMLRSHNSILERWREDLPEPLRWIENGLLPSDILSSRLRAKYWGARYVVNRPFLDYVLHIMPYAHDNAQTLDLVARDGHGNSRDEADIRLFMAIQHLQDSEIWAAANSCVLAAIRSTVAFDYVPGRLIVTNIHGTAHAQFGNMLVLAAVHTNSFTNHLLPRGLLKTLFARTLNFLSRLAPISPTCQEDHKILEKLNHTLFGIGEDP